MLEDLLLEEECPNSEAIDEAIQDHLRNLTTMETLCEGGIENLRPKAAQDPMVLALDKMSKNMWGVAQATPIELPKFYGKSSAEYAAFKNKFQFIIPICNIP